MTDIDMTGDSGENLGDILRKALAKPVTTRNWDLPQFEWIHYALIGHKITAIKSLRANVAPGIDLMTAKKIIDSLAALSKS